MNDRAEERRQTARREDDRTVEETARDLEELTIRRLKFIAYLAGAAAVLAVGVAIVSFVISRRVESNSNQVQKITCVTIAAYQTAAKREHILGKKAASATTRTAHEKSADAIDMFIRTLKIENLRCKPPLDPLAKPKPKPGHDPKPNG